MEGRLFALVCEEDETLVFAFGMEIESDRGVEAVVYRKDPETAQPFFGLHGCAEAAQRRYSSAATPLRLEWQDGCD